MPKRSQTPARSPDARNKQLIKLAADEAERRLRNGTASSQMITALLNASSEKTKLEVARLKSDLAVANAKIKQMEAQANSTDMYAKAIEAFRRYSGNRYDEEEEDYYDD